MFSAAWELTAVELSGDSSTITMSPEIELAYKRWIEEMEALLTACVQWSSDFPVQIFDGDQAFDHLGKLYQIRNRERFSLWRRDES